MGRKRHVALDLNGADAVMRAVVSTCLGQYRCSQARYLAAPGVEPLHELRVNLQRLRSALALYRPLTGALPEFDAGLRQLSGALGDARDLDVLLARTPPGALHDRLVIAQAQAATHALAALNAAPTRAMLATLADWIVLHPAMPAADAQAFAASQFARWRRKVKRAGPALTTGDDAARHQLRRRVKRLRHAVELLGSLFPASGRQARFRAALLPLQDALGSLNDMVVAQALLARIGSSRVRGAAVIIGRAQRPGLLAHAAAAHAQLLDAPRFWR